MAIDLLYLFITSVTLNVMTVVSWLLEALQRSVKTPESVNGHPEDGVNDASRTRYLLIKQFRMFRIVDLVVSQCLALYAVGCILWLPLLEECFEPASQLTANYTMPAVAIAVGRHVFCLVRGWRSPNSGVDSFALTALPSWCHIAIPIVSHALSATCLLLFMATRANLVFAALLLLSELGNIYVRVSSVLDKALPTWMGCPGVIFAALVNGLSYLIVVALALARRSPLVMEPLAIALFFFYIAFSFTSNAYSIYLVLAGFINCLLEDMHRTPSVERFGAIGHMVPPQALANMRNVLHPPPPPAPATAAASSEADEISLAGGFRKVSEGDEVLLISNMVV